jgi:Na+/citrate or Na+/malate symporter
MIIETTTFQLIVIVSSSCIGAFTIGRFFGRLIDKYILKIDRRKA